MADLTECATCSAPFTPYRATNRFCSDKCRYRAKGGTSKLKPPAVCRHCGISFPDMRGAATRSFCSRTCLGAWTRLNPVFGPAMPALRPLGIHGPPVPACVVCGLATGGRRYCGGCRFKRWRETPEGRRKYRERRRSYKHRRRAQKAGAEDNEVFTRRSIFERDGWRCGICGAHINPSLKFPDHMSATIDHTLPLAKGGSHTRANVQAAHWICNVRKSDGVAGQAEQLRLVG